MIINICFFWGSNICCMLLIFVSKKKSLRDAFFTCTHLRYFNPELQARNCCFPSLLKRRTNSSRSVRHFHSISLTLASRQLKKNHKMLLDAAERAEHLFTLKSSGNISSFFPSTRANLPFLTLFYLSGWRGRFVSAT